MYYTYLNTNPGKTVLYAGMTNELLNAPWSMIFEEGSGIP